MAELANGGFGATDAMAVLEDRRIWRELRPVAESLLDADDGSEMEGVEVRQFDDESIPYEACAVSLAELTDHADAVLLMVKPKQRRFPSKSELRRRFDLTPREAEVALLLARRRTNGEIADALCFTTSTARRHTERVLHKLGVKRRTQVESVLSDA